MHFSNAKSRMYQILACGSNGQFQLGNGSDEDLDRLQPVHFTDDITIHGKPVKIAGGGNHTLMLFEDGQVYGTGSNEFGQTGVYSETEKTVPVFTPVAGKWKDIACGWEFLVLLDTEGSAWSCGFGPKGELGLGSGNIKAAKLTPLHMPKGSCFESIHCGVFQTIGRTAEGQLYGWGVCRKGQLGFQPKLENGKPRASIWSPEKLEVTIDCVLRYEMGREFTYIEGRNHQIYRLGPEITPVQLTDDVECFDQIEAMWSSIHFRSQNRILSQGNNSHGQLLKDMPTESVVSMATGSEHGLVLTEKNSIYAWGWGEHGNCGQRSKNLEADDDSGTFSKLNLIYKGTDKVVAIAGGCATSWVVVEK